MRKRLAVAAAALVVIAAALFTWWLSVNQAPAFVSEAFGANPRETLNRELTDPSSIWAKALRDPADLARFKDAPAYRIELDYAATARRLTGKEAILFTNTTGEAVSTLYLFTGARAWGDPSWDEEAFTLTDLQVNGQTVPYTQKELYGEIHLERPLKPGATDVIDWLDSTPWVGPDLVADGSARQPARDVAGDWRRYDG